MRSSPAVLRIANFSGFLGDRASAAEELLASSEIDVLTGDWLAELTMTILQRQREKDPLAGFASAFLRQVESVLGTCVDRGVRIVSNAGGLNPAGCARALEELAQRLGLTIGIGHVAGDDVMTRLNALADDGCLSDFYTGEPLDVVSGEHPVVANAYFGGWGIADALDRAADIVVTGRVADASLVVGPAAWAFGWRPDDWDKLAGAVVAGHVIECGAQATGGNFPFFEQVPAAENIGFPIAEISSDGSCVITKSEGSGGLVTVDTVTAQLLYEIQSTRYAGPDVTTLLDSIALHGEGRDRVRISAARGMPPTQWLKVAVAYAGGFRNSMTLVVTGTAPEAKAELAQRAIWARIPGGKDAFDDVAVELVGRPESDPKSLASACCMLRIAVSGDDKDVVGRGFSSAVVETALASYPGFFATTPPAAAAPYVRYEPALASARSIPMTVTVDGVPKVLPHTGALYGAEHGTVEDPYSSPAQLDGKTSHVSHQTRVVPLGAIVGARSGDKGGDANLGVWARDDTTFRWMDDHLTVDAIRELIPEANSLNILRYRLPNIRAVNFVIRRFLDDGVSSCLRLDGQAKGLAEYFLSRYFDVPEHIAALSVRRQHPIEVPASLDGSSLGSARTELVPELPEPCEEAVGVSDV